MAAELLFVPFKKSSDVDIVKPLRNLINTTYNTGDQHEDYTDALNELSRLRANAIWKVFEKSSLEVIYSYHDQLASLESKLPPQEVQIPFKWKDAFDKGSLFGGRMSLTISSLAYERMCILFNIGAMQSLIASQQTIETEESLKQAAKLFQQAAGVFLFLKANIMMAVHQETTPDLHPETLDALAKLMLAQAQEVIAYKCIRDEMKESMVAKVCAQCDELYTDALRAMQKEQLKSLWERDWLPLIVSKQMAFRGLTQLYQSLVCRANKSVGEEIARLQVAEECMKQAGARVAPSPFLAEQAARVQRQLAAARKDNDFIYHERIPDAAALEPVARAAIAKPQEPPARWAGAPELFAGLVPAAVHAALQAAAARRADLVGAEIDRLRDATQLLNSVLASLNLPACIEPAAGGGGLPESIRSKAAAVREAGGLPELTRLMAELPELLQRNKDILDEAERMLREEAEADAALRTQFGSRWARTESHKLTESFRANADKYRQIIDNAVRADNIVQQKLAQHRDNIALLGGSEGELTAGVPRGPEGGAAPGGAPARRLRELMAAADELKAARDALEAELKDTTVDMRARFLEALAADGCVDEPALAGAALAGALAPLRGAAGASLARQEALLAEVRAAHAELLGARGPASGRDEALGRLCAAADAFQELTANLNEGIKFYNDLTQLLVAFQNKVSDFCFARKTEKDELLKDLTQEAARGSGRPAPAPPQHHAAAEARRWPRARRAAAAPAAPRARARPRARPRRRRAALPATAARHAGAVRRRGLPVLRGAAAAAVQPVRHAAVPAPRAHAGGGALPALPVPRAGALPAAAAARRLQPLPAAAVAAARRRDGGASPPLHCNLAQYF